MSGYDTFAIMRTGGGKSLPYQIPALLLEGQGSERRVTVVLLPLLSWIRDQENQMNVISGSAIHKWWITGEERRWKLVRDRNAGVYI